MHQPRDLLVGLVDFLGSSSRHEIEKLIKTRVSGLSQQAGHPLLVRGRVKIKGTVGEAARDSLREKPQLFRTRAWSNAFHDVESYFTVKRDTTDSRSL
jgi:hypothetical protein